MKEADVRKHLIAHLEEFGHIEPIENIAGTGNPDVNYCFNGYEGWIEVKYARTLPKRENTRVFGKCLKPSQHIWFRKRYGNGYRRLFIYGRALDTLFLIPGYLHYEFEEMTWAELHEYCVWKGTPRNSDWLTLHDVLIKSYRNLPAYLSLEA
jgi:hypothetical protein